MTVAQTRLAPARPLSMSQRLRDLRGRLSRSEAWFGYLLAAPALAVIVAALATPIALLVLYSFWTQDYVTVDTTLTLDNYRTIADRPIYLSVMLRSVAISGIVTLLTVLLASPASAQVIEENTWHVRSPYSSLARTRLLLDKIGIDILSSYAPGSGAETGHLSLHPAARATCIPST